MNRYEKELRIWKTKAAAISNATKLTAEFSQVGYPATFTAVQKSNGYWTIQKNAQPEAVNA